MDMRFLAGTALFRGIREDEIEAMLPCLQAYERSYDKGEVLLRAGDLTSQIGLVETGSVNVVVNFWWGDSNIFGHIGAGETFAENYAAVPGRELLCDIVAAEPTTALFLNMDAILTTCQKRCHYHRRLIHNLVRVSAMKNLDLSGRMMHIAPKTIRGRLLSYLSEQAFLHGSPNFSIPFSRQQLADYLGVDRSALSNELGKMQRDGLISFHRNEFVLHERAKEAVYNG